jgi:glycosyltransferase involved in cell wall biosynthesis
MSKSVMDDLSRFRSAIPVRLNPHPLFDNFGPLADRTQSLEHLGLDTGKRWILFFGFIRAYKGLDLLIEAFADRRLRPMNLGLIIAGEFYEDDKPYRELVKKFNLGEELVFFDRFINDQEVSYFFSACDLVVQPYRDATQSGVTQIAYHFEKPMVVTDVGGLREIVPHGRCGYVVNPEPGKIADAVYDFVINNRSGEFKTGLIEEKKKYLWDRMTASALEVYHKTLRDDNKK